MTELVTVPPLAHHEELDLKLRQAAGRIAESFLDFCDLAAEAIRDGVPAHYGYLDERAYFDERLGISYRTLRRWFSVSEGIGRLAEPERPQARAALAALGGHKASVLAPLLGRDGHAWPAWAERARTMTEEALQEAVSTALGTMPRGCAVNPSDRFLRLVLAHMPPDTVEYVEGVFRQLMALGDTDNPIAAFLSMVDLANQELGHLSARQR